MYRASLAIEQLLVGCIGPLLVHASDGESERGGQCLLNYSLGKGINDKHGMISEFGRGGGSGVEFATRTPVVALGSDRQYPSWMCVYLCCSKQRSPVERLEMHTRYQVCPGTHTLLQQGTALRR